MTAKTVRAATYVRVSTADQIDNTSLDEQRKLCRGPCWPVPFFLRVA